MEKCVGIAITWINFFIIIIWTRNIISIINMYISAFLIIITFVWWIILSIKQMSKW